MSQLDGRTVYTRAEQQERTGRSLSYLEKLYRERQENGHPEPVGTLNRAKVWDAEAWDTWYDDWTDVSALATLEDLAEQVGRSRATVRKAWANRATNEHPLPRKRVDGIDFWEPEKYFTWFTETYLPSFAGGRPITRTGHPDDLVTSAEGSRSIGYEPDSTAKYKTRPPAGWPKPVPGAEEQLPGGGTREKYRLGDFWDYATRKHPGGGRPANASARRWPYDGDPRLTIAREAIASTPADEHPQLTLRLAGAYPDTTAGTWSHILAAARRHPTD